MEAVVSGAVVDRAFWRGRRVFLTGHTGFKGSWLALWLESMGAEVHGFALAPATSPSLYEVARVGTGLTSVIADIRDEGALTRALRDADPSVVLHLAAQPLVRASYREPVATFATNVMGTAHLLEAARGAPNLRAVVVVTTDKVYDNREWTWGYREVDALGGHDPYSSSKAAAEMVTAAYRHSFLSASAHGAGARTERAQAHPVGVATARAGNVIGGGDWAEDRLLPDLLRALGAGQPVQVRHPHAVRPWQHVVEPLSGYLRLAERLAAHPAPHAEAWNFGPNHDDAKPVSWICDRVTAQWGHGARWETTPGDHPHETSYLSLDIAKARRQLDWRPRLDLATALDWTIGWHQRHARGDDMRAVTLDQLRHFESLA